jgi:hypothetical protein
MWMSMWILKIYCTHRVVRQRFLDNLGRNRKIGRGGRTPMSGSSEIFEFKVQEWMRMKIVLKSGGEAYIRINMSLA